MSKANTHRVQIPIAGYMEIDVAAESREDAIHQATFRLVTGHDVPLVGTTTRARLTVISYRKSRAIVTDAPP